MNLNGEEKRQSRQRAVTYAASPQAMYIANHTNIYICIYLITKYFYLLLNLCSEYYFALQNFWANENSSLKPLKLQFIASNVWHELYLDINW